MSDDLETRLRSLTPGATAASPLAAAYAAGLRVGRRTATPWRAAAAVFAVAAVAPWAVVRTPPLPRPVAVRPQAATPAGSPLRDAWRLRDDLLARGLDAIPTAPLPPPSRTF